MIGGLKREGVTVLISSHLLDQVQRLCDRVALFQRGRIVMMGTVPELARQVLGAGFVVDVEADRRAGARSGAAARRHSGRDVGGAHRRRSITA